MIFGDSFVASTIGAETFAEWQMNVKCNTFFETKRSEGMLDLSLPNGRCKIILPVGYRRVRGVSRCGDIIFLDELSGERHGEIFLVKLGIKNTVVPDFSFCKS